MAHARIVPTGRESHFGDDEIIVSKTDLRGVLTYANDVFIRISGYTESELIGQPHNVIRHPEMPRAVFKLLWDTIKTGQEIFAYVLNMSKSGNHYWVFAHVTASYDLDGHNVGYHSNRRVAEKDALAKIKPLYAQLVQLERAAPNPKAALDASTTALFTLLNKQGREYSEFVFGLSAATSLESMAR